MLRCPRDASDIIGDVFMTLSERPGTEVYTRVTFTCGLEKEKDHRKSGGKLKVLEAFISGKLVQFFRCNCRVIISWPSRNFE